MSDYTRIYTYFNKTFSGDSIFIVNGDELVVHPAREIKKLERFLGLEDFFKREHFYFTLENGGKFPCFKVPEVRCMGSDKGLVHPKLRDDTLVYMRNLLAPKMRKFKELTGVDVTLP